jgi:hypothetical protein
MVGKIVWILLQCITRDRIYTGSTERECVSNAVVSVMAGCWLKGEQLEGARTILCTVEDYSPNN